MNLRHAGALALVGWYLMTPPYSHSLGGADDHAPLAEWTLAASYDSAKECEEVRSRIQDRTKRDAPPAGVDATTTKQRVEEEDLYAECIETTDPRLKAN
jgi:hypothetical protein